MRINTVCAVFVFLCGVLFTVTPVLSSQQSQVPADPVPENPVPQDPVPQDPVPVDQLDRLLDEIEHNFSKIKTLKTMLKQEKSIPVFSEKVFSSGFCIFKSPDKLRLEFTDPFKSSLIIDGQQVFKYEFFDGAWQKLSTGNKEILLMIMGNITSWLKGRFKDPNLYNIKAYNNEAVIIILTPKAEEFQKYITSFELGLNVALNGLDYIIINERQNTYTKIHFFNDQVNTQIPDTIFQGAENSPTPVLPW